MEAHEIPESIQWHEGLLLTPQHFQQLSLRHESLLQYVAGALSPFNWGVRDLKLEIKDDELRVERLAAVMPDGLVVSSGAPRGEGLRLSLGLREFEEALKDPGGSVMVYLAVPAREAGAEGNGEEGRYVPVLDGEPVADERLAGVPRYSIPRLRPRLKLLTAGQMGKGYVGFPVARVSRDGTSYTLRGFVPPLLAVGAGAELSDACSRSLELIRSRARYLSNRLVDLGRASGAAAYDRDRESLLRSLAAPLPQLDAVLSVGASHPYVVFLAFCAAAGQLATLGDCDLPLFKPYNHDDLLNTFGQVFDYIRKKVDAAVPLSVSAHVFDYDEDAGVYQIRFAREWAGMRLAVGMRPRAEVSRAETARWGEGSVIGADREMESLRRRRVTGIVRFPVEHDEELVPAPGEVLFALAPDRGDYPAPGELLQIFNDGEGARRRRPAVITLYVSRKV